MDFRHLIVTCLFSKLRLPFDNQKVKENYAIFLFKFVYLLLFYLLLFEYIFCAIVLLQYKCRICKLK